VRRKDNKALPELSRKKARTEHNSGEAKN